VLSTHSTIRRGVELSLTDAVGVGGGGGAGSVARSLHFGLALQVGLPS
jgi:hypothetical protein